MFNLGIDQNLSCFFKLVLADQQTARQHAERALNDAHIGVGDEIGDPGLFHQGLCKGQQNGIVRTDKFDHLDSL